MPVLSPMRRFWVFARLRFVLRSLALCCVALLCAVYVRLHLVLFLVGGPVLLSLAVKIYYVLLTAESA
jgi:hypothetical protein